MMDLANKENITFHLATLSQTIDCPIIPIEAHRGFGMAELKKAIYTIQAPPNPLSLPVPKSFKDIQETLFSKLSSHPLDLPPLYLSYRLLEGDSILFPKEVKERVLMDVPHNLELDLIVADARYQAIHQLVTQVQKKSNESLENFTAKVDRIVLHQIWGIPIFFAMMYLLFFLAIHTGALFKDFFDLTSDLVFVKGSAWLLQLCYAPSWLIALISNGIGKGINTTLTFIPVIASMFFFLSFLEISGYMARAAFVVDKAMRFLGLPGKAFIPMIVGFGCNVPAILGARTLETRQERFLTILMTPFMSCGARLTIYAVFVSVFFPDGGHNIVFSLYFIGIVMAVLTGFFARNSLLKGKTSPLLLELPTYHRPTWQRLYRDTTHRLYYFIVRAGKVIIPVCIILGGLNTLTIHGRLTSSEGHSDSILAFLAQKITPLFSPWG